MKKRSIITPVLTLALAMMTATSSFAAKRERNVLTADQCLSEYKRQANKDMQTLNDDTEILSYQGSTYVYRWDSRGNYRRSTYNHFTLNRGHLGAGVGFVTTLGLGLTVIGSMPVSLPFTLGIFGGAATQVAIETATAARRLKSYAVITQSTACSVDNNCEFEDASLMNKVYKKAQKKGFKGSLIEMTDKISDAVQNFCIEKIKTKRNGRVKRKVKKTYGIKRILKRAEVI